MKKHISKTPTPDTYQQIISDCARLSRLVYELHEKLLQLRSWHGDLTSNVKEFEQIRTDAIRGSISDGLALIPAKEIGKFIVDQSVYATSAKFVSQLVAGYFAAQALVSTFRTATDRKTDEQIRQIETTQEAIHNATASLVAWDEVSSRLLIKSGKTLSAATQIAAFAAKQEGSSSPVSILNEDTVELVGDLWGTFDERMGVSLKLTKLFLWEEQARHAKDVIANLQSALVRNWDAEAHLKKQLSAWRYQIHLHAIEIGSFESRNHLSSSCPEPPFGLSDLQ